MYSYKKTSYKSSGKDPADVALEKLNKAFDEVVAEAFKGTDVPESPDPGYSITRLRARSFGHRIKMAWSILTRGHVTIRQSKPTKP